VCGAGGGLLFSCHDEHLGAAGNFPPSRGNQSAVPALQAVSALPTVAALLRVAALAAVAMLGFVAVLYAAYRLLAVAGLSTATELSVPICHDAVAPRIWTARASNRRTPRDGEPESL
jgi:hypothetical protein